MDLIDRQAAIDALDKHCDVVCQYSKKQRSVMCGACTLGTAFDVIEGLPSIQTRKGKWVFVDYGGFGNYHCSLCRKICIGKKNYNFCPNCGADMRPDDN